MILGTTVELISEFSSAVDTATITIIDPLGAVVVNEQSMEWVSDFNYRYLFQSSEAMEAGKYTALIKATSVGFVVQDVEFFDLDKI